MSSIVSSEIIPTPHDSMLFGIDTYEIQTVSSEILEQVIKTPGHYTIKLNPIQSKKLLHQYGFYYCDTLIEPHCQSENFMYHENIAIDCKLESNIDDLLILSQHVFRYGRFHRDFNISTQHAENRYHHWLTQLHDAKNIYTLFYQNELAGFIAVVKNKLVLHALSSAYQNKRLAKFFWSKVCAHLYELGHNELSSSISAANLAAVNLYASLGFHFREAMDVYHRLVR